MFGKESLCFSKHPFQGAFFIPKEVKIMDKIPEKLLEAVKDASPEGRINCADAHALAEKLAVDVIIIGKAAEHLNIRIKKCQLGCF